MSSSRTLVFRQPYKGPAEVVHDRELRQRPPSGGARDERLEVFRAECVPKHFCRGRAQVQPVARGIVGAPVALENLHPKTPTHKVVREGHSTHARAHDRYAHQNHPPIWPIEFVHTIPTILRGSPTKPIGRPTRTPTFRSAKVD